MTKNVLFGLFGAIMACASMSTTSYAGTQLGMAIDPFQCSGISYTGPILLTHQAGQTVTVTSAMGTFQGAIMDASSVPALGTYAMNVFMTVRSLGHLTMTVEGNTGIGQLYGPGPMGIPTLWANVHCSH